ncbi:MAG: riboflavin synthase [Propionibacteriaceae bacterium]|nr:riboflavin synthase [Propionibacteriaceae bacterium]
MSPAHQSPTDRNPQGVTLFTGIVEELGEVRALHRGADSASLTIRGPLVVSDTVRGASISVNGVCLTVVEHDAETFTVDVIAETLNRSSLGALSVGDPVNLERAMRADGRFGGHIVQGHIDGTAMIRSRTPGDNWEVVRIDLPELLARYVVEKGSLTVDGVSLTVSGVGRDDDAAYVEVSLIPTTLELTTLGRKQPGDPVNLEVDILAKYVERLLTPGTGR